MEYKLLSEIEKIESKAEFCDTIHEFYSCLDEIVDYNRALSLETPISVKKKAATQGLQKSK